MPLLRPTSRELLITAVLGAVVLWTGCHRAAVAPPSPVGRSAHAFLEPPAPPLAKGRVETSAELQPTDVLLLAKPIPPLRDPAYPVEALGSSGLPVVIHVRIVVDDKGSVSDVRASPLRVSTPTRHFDRFFAEIEAALRDWRFRPAVLRHLVPVKDGDGAAHWVVARANPTDCTFDVAFTFNATGDVVSALAR